MPGTPEERALFDSHARESSWEWAKSQRRVFTSPAKDLGTGAVVAVVTGFVLYALGDQSWFNSTVAGVLALVIIAIVGPYGEALLRLARRNATLVEERDREIERLRAVAPAPPALPIDKPKAELQFVCDRTGWARVRVTNSGPGAMFSATIQTYGLAAGAVEGRLVQAQWEETSGPTQRIARGDTRVLRLASLEPIASGVFAWKIHRSDGASFTGVDRNEVLDVTLVADPDLAEPCSRRFSLHADAESTMAPGLASGPVHKNPRGEPQRITDMRRLLLEAAAYVRSIPYGVGDAKVAIEMSVDVKLVVADLLGQAFGFRMIAVYGNLFNPEPRPQEWQEISATFLMDLSQKLTQQEIAPDFRLPQSWREFYESDREREWRDWAKWTP